MNIVKPSPIAASPRDLWAVPRAWADALARRFGAQGRRAWPVPSTVSLDKGATTWVEQPFCRQVICDSGSLWLCYDGEPIDVLLGPGDRYLCAKRSALTIYALAPSVVRLA